MRITDDVSDSMYFPVDHEALDSQRDDMMLHVAL